MAKKISSSRPTRDHHKQRNNWVVIDIRAAMAKLAEIKRNPKFAALGGHEGKLLDAIRTEIVLLRTEGAYSEHSARLLASNNGRWSKYQEARRLGLTISRKYMDERSFAVVETAVFERWLKKSHLDWDAAATRSELYSEQGVAVLPRLCTSFIPPGETEEEYQASLPGISRRANEAAYFGRNEKSGRPRNFKPAKRPRFYIVDLDEYRLKRRNLILDSADRDLKHLDVPKEGTLFKRATVTPLLATNWRNALEKFRNRLAGEMNYCLPQGRFTAISENAWKVLVELPNLPYNLSREHLLYAVRLAGKRDTKLRRIEEEAMKRLGRFAWLPSWEPGMDEVKQLPLPGTYLLKDLLEFPPRDHVPRRTPLVKGRLPRIEVRKRNGRCMRQLPLPSIPRFTLDSSGQSILFACDKPFEGRLAEKSSCAGQLQPPEEQLALRFPRPSSEWSQPPLFAGMEVRKPKRRFVPRRNRIPQGQVKLPFSA